MEIQHKNIAITAVVFALLGIVLGAFGAHSLEAVLSADKLASFEVGIRYQMYHALALLFLSLITLNNKKAVQQSFVLMLLGVSLFSGSIYVLAFTQVWNFSPGALVFLTPLGGALLIIGWLRLLLGVLKIR